MKVHSIIIAHHLVYKYPNEDVAKLAIKHKNMMDVYVQK